MTFLFGVGEKNKTKTKMKKAILLFLFVSTSAIAQVGINTSSPDASAALDVESTTGGILIPRMTQVQRDAIASPSNGLMIYQTDQDSGFYYYDGSSWSNVGLSGPTGPAGPAGPTGPTGSIVAFAGINIPDGWLVCDGTAVDRTTYSDLFAVISDYWGSGDGSTTFNLPDFRGRFLRGVDSGAGNDSDASSRFSLNAGGNSGDNVGSYQNDQLKSHNHQIPDYVSTSSTRGQKFRFQDNGSGAIEYYVTTDNSGGSETRPKNAGVIYIIKH